VGVLEGPNLVYANSGVAKTLSLHKHYTLRFEAPYANVATPANYAPPQTNIRYPSFVALDAVLP
jgi:hypothetical protein